MGACLGKKSDKNNTSKPSENKIDPDFHSKNIKGVILRIQHYEGIKGLKLQVEKNWPQVNEDYYIIDKFLKSPKSKNKKFIRPTTIVKNRKHLIEKIIRFSKGKYKLDPNLKSQPVKKQEPKKSVKERVLSENSDSVNWSKDPYMKQASEFGVPVFQADKDASISQIGRDVEVLKQKYGIAVNDNKGCYKSGPVKHSKDVYESEENFERDTIEPVNVMVMGR